MNTIHMPTRISYAAQKKVLLRFWLFKGSRSLWKHLSHDIPAHVFIG